jgi:predicted component of type VI protein secretion system
MSLTLTIRNAEIVPEGVTPSFTLEGDSAVIGRSKNCDWNLPDSSNVISSRHAELRRDGETYFLKDTSTNGTFVNGAAERMAGEHRIAGGDVIRIGQYELVASIARAAPPPPPPPEPEPAREPAPERTVIQPAGADVSVGQAEDQPPENVTVMWDSLADINKVDWARGGLGSKEDAAAAAAAAGEAQTTAELIDAFVATLALGENGVPRSPDLVSKAGSLLKRLISGMVVMVEARARAKAQMGAEATGLQLEGNNPIKFARSPEQALARLLSPPEPGFMEAERAVEDAFLDLQSHQVATLRAIPGALRATLDRFSPGAIRRRAEKAGLLARIMPALQDAALWRNYEREYVKVKNESDEAFMEVFAKEFRKAYERQLREGFEEPKSKGL